MSYPKNPENITEALITLAEFAQIAPGRLPERVEIAIKMADELKALKGNIK
jgi:HAMP domain-containing protein